jgi:hypothetical protein
VLVVLFYGEAPGTEPRREGRNESPALQWVIADLLPFPVCELALFVEDVRVDGELADVMKERRPAEPVAISEREPQFVGDHVSKSPHTLGVPPGPSIVAAQRCCKGQDFCGYLGRHLWVGSRGAVRAAFELSGQACPPRDLQPFRRLVGKKHGHPQQSGEGQGTPAKALGADKSNARRPQDHHPPERMPGQVVPARNKVPDRDGCGQRHGERDRNSRARYHRTQHSVGPPPVRLGHYASALARRGAVPRHSTVRPTSLRAELGRRRQPGYNMRGARRPLIWSGPLLSVGPDALIT